ncbi:MAG: FxsA family protein [candidate division KSB1 bacterium]
MRLKLFLLFIGVPLLELAILVQLGQVFGFWSTLAIIILTGIAGAALARWQGLRVLLRMQAELAAGKIPAAELLEGLLILIAGVMLLTPGFLTDLCGLLLLLPPVRYFVRAWLQVKLLRMLQSGQTRIFMRGGNYISDESL